MRSRLFIYVSLGADVTIAISKFIAAGITGSSSMISEGIHSVIDAASQLMLIWGVKKSKRKPDDSRPFGYGRELYFWSFMVSLVMFLLGGCISFYEGLRRLRNPEFTGSPNLSYATLAIALVFTGVSVSTALKVFNKQRGDTNFFKAITRSKDPSVFIVLLGDIGDMLGLVVAFLGIYLGRLLHNPYYDAGASMIIGVILLGISMLLVRESKSLLMGEPIGKAAIRKIVAIAEADAAIVKIKKHFSTYMAPEEVLLQLIAVFKEDLNTDEITVAIERIINAIKAEYPRINRIFIEPVAK